MREIASVANDLDDNIPDEESPCDAPIHRIDLRTITEAEAKHALKTHKGLVYQFAQRLMPRTRVVHWIEFEDLVAVGQIALLEAVASFDPTRTNKLSTWLGHIIKRRMLEAIRRARGQTRSQQQTAFKLYAIEKRTETRKRHKDLGKPAPEYRKPDPSAPSEAEMASLKTIQEAKTVSTETTINGYVTVGDTLCSTEVDPLEDTIRQAQIQWLRQVMRRLLTPGMRAAVMAEFMDEPTADIALRLGISRQRVSELRKKGLLKIQRAARQMGWTDLPPLFLVQ